MTNPNFILQIENLSTYYSGKKKLFSKPSWTYALKDFNLQVQEGEFIGIVGESGCGKSTLGNTLAGLIAPTRGKVYFHNQLIIDDKKNFINNDLLLRRKIQIIFQDPYSSINPKHKIKKILGSPLMIHKLAIPKNLKEKIEELLRLVHLDPSLIERYPHQLSGGQRQRLGIARAISLQPEILICDEITSALDVSVQAFIIDLLFEIKNKMNLTIFFVTHDLSLIRNISNRICVMYGGEVVETGNTANIFSKPKHPYTKALLNAIPTLNRNKKPVVLEGEPPKMNHLYDYCIFYERCHIRKDICKQKKPQLQNEVKCFFPFEN